MFTILILFSFMFVTSVTAGFFSKDKEVWMQTNQSVYYVPLNVQGGIPLEITNDFDNAIDTSFTFSITQIINQGNMQSQSTNSQTQGMSVAPKNQTLYLGVGPANTPGELDITIQLSYTDPDTSEQKTATMNGLKVIFIDENDKNNKQQQQSKEQQEKDNEKKKSEQQSQSQQEKEQQKQQEEQRQNQEEQKQQQNNQKLQNSQGAQDTNALRQQMEKQKQEREQKEQEFQNKIADSKEFQEENKKLEEQGYKLDKMNTDIEKNDTGSFNAEYKNDKGENAQMKGEMQNSSMQNVASQTQEQRDSMKNQLTNTSRFQQFDEKMRKAGLNTTNLEYGKFDANSSVLTVQYKNDNNETGNITATYINDTLKKIETQYSNDNNFRTYLIIVILLLLIAGFIFYKLTRPKKSQIMVVSEEKKERPFDFLYYCKHELDLAKRSFDSGDMKEAYAKCANALRVFYSYKFADKKEIVNYDAIVIAKKNKFKYELLKDTLNLCSLVEFAKYKPNKDDFNEILSNSKKIIEK
ncbi:MAG: hypothetical protein WC755_05130 [Candidatus Woesearchaeota archaeon]